MNKNNKIYGIQRYSRDVLGYTDIFIPGCIDLPAFIFEDIFKKYEGDIWFYLGQLQGAKHRTDAKGSYHVILNESNDKYCFSFIMGDTYSTTEFDDETSFMISNYLTSIKREENLIDLLG